MERSIPYLGTATVLLIGVFLVIFSGSVTVPHSVTPSAAVASSTLSVVPHFAPAPLTLPSIEAIASTSVLFSTTTRLGVAKQPSASVPIDAPIPAPLSSSGNAELDAAAVALRSALVNIICYAPPNGALRSITGSGVIVDPKGIILTNAHIAQYFLLANRGVSCTIRTGSPAVAAYKASLMYISPKWLSANSSVITERAPIGTGQYDFAFLAITSSATPTALPSSFSFVPLASDSPSISTPVAIASYAAQSLGFAEIQSDLTPTVVFGSVQAVFTFALNSIDVLALGGSAAAQEGSSGGGAVDGQGNLVATLTTSTISGAASTRSLDAITASYIRTEYANETGQSLDFLFSQNPATVAATFALRMPALESIITANLP